MTQFLVKKLVEEYYASRPNLEVHNAPLCVFFFACSGSGKSTMRRLLVDRLNATYVCNDEVRELISRYPEATAQGIELKTIVAEAVEKIFTQSPNKLVIFDNNIIQYYMYPDSYLNVAKAKSRPVFIIGLEVAKEVLVERIKARGVHVVQILAELPGQIEAYNKAAQDIKPDWSANPNDDIQELLKDIRNSQAR